MSRIKYIAMVLAVGLLVSVASSQEAAAQAKKRQALIFLKVLSYDRVMTSGSGQITIGVISGSNSKDGDDMFKALKSLEAAKIKGRPFRAVKVPYSQTSLAKDLRSKGIDVAYVATDLSGEARSIAAVARSVKVPMLCPSRSMVEAGLSVATFRDGKRMAIVVNLPAAKASGLALSSRILRLADVIR